MVSLGWYLRGDPMKFKVCVFFFCLFALAGPALAQNKVDGKWVGDISTPRGSSGVTLVLKSDGNKLTGTIDLGLGDSPIENGTINGNTITFSQRQSSIRSGNVTMNYTGTISGDEIKFTRKTDVGEGQVVEFTAKRAK